MWVIAILYCVAFKRGVDRSGSFEELKRALSFIGRGQISGEDAKSMKSRLNTFPKRYKQFKSKSNKAMLICYLLLPLVPLDDYFLRNKTGSELIIAPIGLLSILVSIQIGEYIASLCAMSLMRKLNEFV